MVPIRNLRILSTGAYQPGLAVPASELNRRLSKPEGWVERKMNILSRHYAGAESTSAMAVKAARQALATLDGPPDCIISAASAAEQALPTNAAFERAGWVWVAVAAPRLPEPPHQMPEAGRFDRLQWAVQVEASLVDALENLLDATHTPFVHRGLVRGQGQRRCLTVQVSRRDGQVEARYRGVEANPGLISRLFERGRSESLGRFQRPALAQLEYRDDKGPSFLLHAHFSPMEHLRQAVFVDLFTRKGWLPRGLKHLPLTPLLRKVLRQYQAILAAKTAQEARFAARPTVSTELDFMRPHLEALLAGPDVAPFEGTTQLWL